LEHIAYPITTIATFDCGISSNENINIYNLLQGAQSAVKYGSGNYVIHSLGIATTLDPYLILKCLLVRSTSFLPVSSEQILQLTVRLSKEGHLRMLFEEVMQTLVNAALLTLPLAGLQALYVFGRRQPEINWPEFLQHLPQIHTLCFDLGLPTKLMNVLVKGIEKTTKSAGPVTPTLPHLRSLWLRSVDFKSPPRQLQSLLGLLRFHAYVGSAVKDLHLKNCWSLSKEDVEKIKELVHDVDWDEVEQEEFDDYIECGRDFEGISDSD
jgi:hypothetical protein